jgi:hypothetical protein
MEYKELSLEEFDAVVTGELTHFALHLEDCLDKLVTEFFVSRDVRRGDFKRLMLHRDGLTFQHKIEIVRAMGPILGETAQRVDLKGLLRRIEDFKAYRNALAHGHDVSSDPESLTMRVETVSRSGKPRTIEITPASHAQMCADTDDLLESTEKAVMELLTNASET